MSLKQIMQSQLFGKMIGMMTILMMILQLNYDNKSKLAVNNITIDAYIELMMRAFQLKIASFIHFS
jgi:hypothetical protein